MILPDANHGNDADATPGQPPGEEARAVLELRGVSRRYALKRGLLRTPDVIKAVDDVSLRVCRGETLGLVGESGCGKSTLARMLLALLKPTSGSVWLDGRPIERLTRLELAERVQPVFQDPYSSLNPRRTVEQIVGMPLALRRQDTSAARRLAVASMLDMVGIPKSMRDRYPGQLSGGQRQRVAIARALILRPAVVVCDEPTSALDVSVQAQILNLLLDLKAELGLTYFFISHDLAVVEHIVDRVAVMRQGRIVELSPRDKLFSAPEHAYTRMLLASALTPEPGLGIPNTPLETTT